MPKKKREGKYGGKKVKLNSSYEQQDYSEDERYALWRYTDSSHINFDLGTIGYDGLPQDDREYVDTLDAAISKSGWNANEIQGNLVRGVGAIAIGVPETETFYSQGALADYINDNLIGKPTTNAGYTSTTRDFDVAEGFSLGQTNGVILKYDRIEKGVRGAYVSGGKGKEPISEYRTSENETVVQRGLRTVPTYAEVVGGNVIVHCWVYK